MSNIKYLWHYVKYYKFNSLLVKNFIIIFLILIIPLGTITLSIANYFNQQATNEIYNNSTNEIERVADTLEEVLREVTQMSVKLNADRNVESFMYSNEDNFAENDARFKLTYYIREDMNKIYNITYLDYIYLYAQENDYLITTHFGGMKRALFFDKEWYDYYQSNKDRGFGDLYAESRIIPYNANSPQNYVSLYKNIYFKYPEVSGVIVYNISHEKVNKLLNIKDNQSIYWIDEKGNILFNNDPGNYSNISQLAIFDEFDIEGHVGKNAIIEYEGVKKIISVERLNSFGFTFINVQPLNQFEEILQATNYYVFLFFVITILISFIIALIISIRVFQPLGNILSIVENPNRNFGDIKIKKDEKIDEVKYIVDSILTVFNNNKQMEQELKKRLGLLKEAQTLALQYQINPHFLYNTLDTIKWKAITLTDSDNDVSLMITYLSKLLRISLESEENVDLISNEIEHARMYLNIQRMRYEDKFDVIWEIDPVILEYKIVKITLQPLIENAIYHGIKPMEGKGTISIKGFKENTKIHIEICDDGVGMTKNDIDELNHNLKNGYEISDEHIGILNVNMRIKMIFGEEYGITFAESMERGTKVIISIPALLND